MSTLSFLFKSAKKMAEKETKRVKVGKYTITKHAQNRIAEKSRKISKWDVISTLLTKPNGVTQIKYKGGRPSYNRVGKSATASINPINNNVVSCRAVSRQDRNEFDLINVSKNKRRKKYVKRNSKRKI